ncbi:MAG: uroporphyrinogen decarboxylase [Saprospiraceae bacterium]|nr:uroporphyrinogen decarboxylase [Saprospiraceae bacterium]
MKLQNDLLLRVANGQAVERPPVWLMRQAGRILPEYRAVREKLHDFKELVTTPERAAEVTIQPVNILGVDAAIIFSDILVIPEALGLDYEMEEKRGPIFPKTIQIQRDIDILRSSEEAAAHLQYVYDALQITKSELNGRVPLIGFCGAPWTLLAYMVEGSGSKTFSKAKKFLYTQPIESHSLLQKITDASIAYLKKQIQNGADLVQIFDSWAGILSPAQYQEFSAKYIAQICNEITEAPITIFAKGAWFALEDFARMDCNIIGLDWNMDPTESRRKIGVTKALQGNLDPCCLYASTEQIRKETNAMLRAFGGKHIANLGHGVYPDTPLDGVRAFIETVQAFRYES